MKKITWIILSLCAGQFTAFGQYLIRGKVFDATTHEPGVGAHVQLSHDPTIGTATNAEGLFELNSPDPQPLLTVSLVGYETQHVQATGEAVVVPLDPRVDEMQAVIVTANREAGLRAETPIAISRLSSQLINETKPTQLVELLNKVPGVVMVNLNNEQHSMSIRQPMTTNAYFLYLEDGLPIRPLGIFNHNALLEVNPFTISSVEVVKGPVSSVYGAEAVGGAVNFITQRPTAVPTAKVGVRHNTLGLRSVQMSAGARTGRFGFFIGGLSNKQTDAWMSHSDYDKSSVSARFEYHVTDRTRLIGYIVHGRYFSETSGGVDSIAFHQRAYVSTSDFTYRASVATRTRLTLEHDGKKQSRSFITLFSRVNELGQLPAYGIRWNPIPGPDNDPRRAKGEINANRFRSYGTVVQHSKQFRLLDMHVIAGGVVDYSPNDYHAHQLDLDAHLRADGKSVEHYAIRQERPDIQLAGYNAHITNTAGYMQVDLSPARHLRLSTGVRFDRMSFTFRNTVDQTNGDKAYGRLTPKIGATYQLGKEAGVYANYAQGFSPPALTAIFRQKPNTLPAAFYYNLEPADFENYEAGGWINWKKTSVDVAIYQLVGTNELLNIRQPDNSTDYQSAGKTLHRGVEFGLSVKPVTELSFRLGGTVAVHRFTDFQVSNGTLDKYQNLDGFEMPGAPRWTWNAEVSYYPHFAANLYTSVEWQHVGGYFQNQINTVRYGGYDLINCRIGYAWKGVTVFGNILNATDALFATVVSRGNRTTDRSTFTPAPPRSFLIGLEYHFVGSQ